MMLTYRNPENSKPNPPKKKILHQKNQHTRQVRLPQPPTALATSSLAPSIAPQQVQFALWERLIHLSLNKKILSTY